MSNSLPPKCDVIIIGTGLVNEIVASLLSLKGLSIINLDKNNFYGSNLCSLNFNDFNNFLQMVSKNTIHKEGKIKQAYYPIKYDSHIRQVELYEKKRSDICQTNLPSSENYEQPDSTAEKINLMKGDCKIISIDDLKEVSNKFSLDLNPKIIFNASLLKQWIVKSGCFKYLQFISVSSIYSLNKRSNEIHKVPLDRSDVFTDTTIPPLEKRLIVRNIKKYSEIDIGKDQQETINNSYNNNWSKKSKLNDIIMKIKVHLENENVGTKFKELILEVFLPLYENLDDTLNEKMIIASLIQNIFENLSVFNKSFLFIWPQYGSSEIAQSFARLAAVNGAIHYLSANIISIESMNESSSALNHLRVNFEDTHSIYCEKILIDANYLDYNVESANIKSYGRAILITNHPLIDSINTFGSKLLIISTNTYPSIDHPIYVLELNHESCVCPLGTYIVHIIFEINEETKLQQNDLSVRELLNPFIEKYFILNDNSERHCENKDCKIEVIWASFFIQESYENLQMDISTNFNIMVSNSINPLFSYTDTCINDAIKIYERFFPEGINIHETTLFNKIDNES